MADDGSHRDADSLADYRGRPQNDESTIEAEMRGLQSLNDSGIDAQLVREVLNSDQLIKAMSEDSTIARLITHATKRLDDCCKIWQQETNPSSDVGLNAHREARAARVLINWIDEVLATGGVAEKLMEEADNHDEET